MHQRSQARPQVPRRTRTMKLVWHSLNLCLLFTQVFVAAFKWIFHDSSVTQLSAEQTSALNNTFNQLCLDNTLWSKFVAELLPPFPIPPFVVHVHSNWAPHWDLKTDKSLSALRDLQSMQQPSCRTQPVPCSAPAAAVAHQIKQRKYWVMEEEMRTGNSCNDN